MHSRASIRRFYSQNTLVVDHDDVVVFGRPIALVFSK
jgi:hypothetical protein